MSSATQTSEPSGEADLSKLSAEDKTSVAALRLKEIPRSPFTTDGYFFWQHGSDCLGTENLRFQGGDLLRTISAHHANIANTFGLKNLTPEITTRLYAQLQGAVSSTEEVYTTQVCRLSADTFIASGTIWPKASPSWWIQDDKLVLDPNQDAAEQRLFLVHQDKVIPFPGVRVRTQTVTGGETEGCAAALAGTSGVTWDCFLGPDRALDGEPIGKPWYERSLLRFTGGAAAVRRHQ